MAALSPTFISLFAGAGGLDLALKLAVPDARCVCYVEREVEAAGILAARIADKALDDAPVWSDVTTFDGKPWRGLVDGIAGGFPCQDLSVAGKRAGIQRGNRSGLFFEYARIIREVDPGWVFIENVPPVFAFPAGGIVLGELAAMGFDAEWGTLRARDVGASHGRKRSWVLAYNKRKYDELLAALQSLRNLREQADAEMERVKACEHIAAGEDGWEALRDLCPSTTAVAELRYSAQRQESRCESAESLSRDQSQVIAELAEALNRARRELCRYSAGEPRAFPEQLLLAGQIDAALTRATPYLKEGL